MKILNKQNQHEIGFDIDCLPKWAKYIAVDEDGRWLYYDERPVIEAHEWRGDDPGTWTNFSQEWGYTDCTSLSIEDYPTNFKGDWTESLFKIEHNE